jgi:AcrR family transcriptional regulator
MPLPRFQNLDADRRQSILAAAAEEFGTHGFAAASYNQIIERAGISKGAMYYYFADKDDLYRTVLETAISQWFDQIGRGFHAEDAEDFWRACEDMYARSLRFMLADPRNAALCLAVTRARERMEAHPALLALHDQMRVWTHALLEHARAIGAVRTDVPADLMEQVALALIDAGDRWLAARWSEQNTDTVASTAKMMVGLLRRAGGTERKR